MKSMEGEDLATTVLTCEGDIEDPGFPFRLQLLVKRLQHLISTEKKPLQVTKVEPWNSVRVTFNIPQEAAQRLRLLAERGDSVLRELGILSVQIEGDQVITLTLAGQFNEPKEIVLKKTNEAQDGISGMSFNFANSESLPGPSTSESSHKKISQFLGNIDGGASPSSLADCISHGEKTDTGMNPDHSFSFPSPNVIAPSSTEPIPFPPPALTTASTTVPTAGKLRVSASSVSKNTGFVPFPFASMTHAMNTKQSGGCSQYHASVRNTLTTANATPLSIVRPQNVSVQQKSAHTPNHAIMNNVGSRVNVALSSPLLVNLLQSETSNLQAHNKLMPPPAVIQAAKRKRKPRKLKDKHSEDSKGSSFHFSVLPSSSCVSSTRAAVTDTVGSLTHSHNVSFSSISSSSSVTVASLSRFSKMPTSVLQSQTATDTQPHGQPPVSVHMQPLSTIHQPSCHQAMPNIHPQAQGQPQVHTGNLPLHSRIPVGSPQLARPLPNALPSCSVSSCNTPSNCSQIKLINRNNSTVIKASEECKENSQSTNSQQIEKSEELSLSFQSPSQTDSFPSPPSSGDGKTTHLINPFTGQLEPMPSDEEEEEESVGSLPPFPDFEADISDKSFSDTGKENHSSDTDSGISKSHTDISQSSVECNTAEPVQRQELSVVNESLSSATVASAVPGEKLKLRLKLDSKVVKESKDVETKERRSKECCSVVNQKPDAASGNISALKKGAGVGTNVVEPRVPPLHISLRGPNAAVVVSPRKEDTKSKYIVGKDESSADPFSKLPAKKVRSPRSSKSCDSHNLATGIGGRPSDLERKSKGSSNRKSKDAYWNQNVKNMSGGGIVEMSEKVSNSVKYETYLPYVPTGAALVQEKSFLVQDTNKSEVITLTSCSTGESVSIRTSASSPAPLPFQVMLGAEQNMSLEMQQTVGSHVQLVTRCQELNTSENSSATCSEEQTCLSKPESTGTEKTEESSDTGAQKSMQKNNLPHSVMEKTPQKERNSQHFVNSIPHVPMYPLSGSSVQFSKKSAVTSSSDHCITSSDASIQTQEMDSCANGSFLTKKTSCEVENKCNIYRDCVQTGVIKSSNADMLDMCEEKSSTASHLEMSCNKSISNRVQTNLNKEDLTIQDIGCSEEKHSLSVECNNEVIVKDSLVAVKKQFVSNGSGNCGNTAFSDIAVQCDVPISKETVLGKDVIEDTGSKLSLDAKKPPIAQIITVDNIAIPSRVIEVPSLSKSAVSSELTVELSSVPSLIPSRGGAFLPVRKLSSSKQSGNNFLGNINNFSNEDNYHKEDDTTPSTFLSSDVGLGAYGRLYENTHSKQENTCPVSEVPDLSSTFPSEESSMDSIDEERKRYIVSSEMRTSTPGPPDEESGKETDVANVDKACNIDDISETPANHCMGEEKPCHSSVNTGKENRFGGSDSSNRVLGIPHAEHLKKETCDARKITPEDSVENLVDPQNKNSSLCSSGHEASVSAHSSTLKSSVGFLAATDESKQAVSVTPSGNEIDGSSTDVEAYSRCSPNSSLPDTHHSQQTSVLLGNAISAVSSQGRLSSSEISAGRSVRLIFKNSSHNTALSANTPTSVVLPLSAAKTVPIKLVTVPGVATGLSVRSTSNPSVVEIIGPKAAVSTVATHRNVHSSSPVRLVVSKVSPNVAGATSAVINQSGTSGVRNCVVVKSVVVTGTSSSIKLVSSAKNELTTSVFSAPTHASSALPIVKCSASSVSSVKSEDTQIAIAQSSCITKTSSSSSESRNIRLKQETAEKSNISCKVPILNCITSLKNKCPSTHVSALSVDFPSVVSSVISGNVVSTSSLDSSKKPANTRCADTTAKNTKGAFSISSTEVARYTKDEVGESKGRYGESKDLPDKLSDMESSADISEDRQLLSSQLENPNGNAVVDHADELKSYPVGDSLSAVKCVRATNAAREEAPNVSAKMTSLSISKESILLDRTVCSSSSCMKNICLSPAGTSELMECSSDVTDDETGRKQLIRPLQDLDERSCSEVVGKRSELVDMAERIAGSVDVLSAKRRRYSKDGHR